MAQNRKHSPIKRAFSPARCPLSLTALICTIHLNNAFLLMATNSKLKSKHDSKPKMVTFTSNASPPVVLCNQVDQIRLRIGKGDDMRTIICSKHALISFSRAFRAMLTGYFREAHQGSVNFPEDHPAALEIALKIAYFKIDP
jgi:hypothetical protein